MIAACRAAGTPLFVAYYRRAQERFLKVKSLVDAGAIGAVRFVTITLCQPAEGARRARPGAPALARDS